MEHASIKYAATFTCHNCQGQSQLRCVEFPPKIYVCGNSECGSVFQLTSQNTDGSTTMKLIRHKD